MSYPLAPGSLVLYKGRPAIVRRIEDRLTIEGEGGDAIKVRPKDVVLLHPGPLASLAPAMTAALDPAEVQAAWEMLAGGQTTLAELTELIAGAFTPAAAWAVWQLVAEGLYFQGTPDAIRVLSAEEVARKQAARAAEAAEKEAWLAFVARARAGQYAPEDHRYLREVEALALGRSSHSRVLRELGHDETPENAHAFLLELGYWDDRVNPYPQRFDVPLSPPDLPLPDLPDEPRRDLTHLTAFAIDDITTDTPDDALSLEGSRLWVHIADAAALIAPDTPLDLEARARAAAVHLPEQIVPMTPRAAIHRLGLGLQEVSPALSFGIDLNEAGEVVGLEIVPSWVRVVRLTYEEAAARIDEEPLRTLRQIAERRQAQRRARGAILIDLPEVMVKVIGGEVVLRSLPSLPSRFLVEEAMIAVGEAVAQYGLAHDLPLPFATQEPAEAEERPTTLSGMFALRRTLKRSQYRAVAGPHGGLGLAAYVQATSPLRRYLDLVVHQQLRALLRGAPPLTAAQIVERIGAVEATLDAIRQVEQLADRHWTLVYLREHPHWRGEGIVVERRGWSDTVLIPELGLEPQLRLHGDYALDSPVPLALAWVNLPRLEVGFRVER